MHPANQNLAPLFPDFCPVSDHLREKCRRVFSALSPARPPLENPQLSPYKWMILDYNIPLISIDLA
jgi:hypothetical protein